MRRIFVCARNSPASHRLRGSDSMNLPDDIHSEKNATLEVDLEIIRLGMAAVFFFFPTVSNWLGEHPKLALFFHIFQIRYSKFHDLNSIGVSAS